MFGPFPNPKNSPLGPQKVKNDPKIESKSNVRIKKKKGKENESCSTTVFVPFPNPKNSPLGPQKVKTTPILSQNQMSELKETKKIKVVALYE